MGRGCGEGEWERKEVDGYCRLSEQRVGEMFGH